MKYFWWIIACIVVGVLLRFAGWNKFPLKNATYRCLRRNFSWLCEDYGFTETAYQSVGSWYYITYRKAETEIKVVFDLRLSEPPVTVLIHAVDCWGLPYDGRKWERQYDRKTYSVKEMIEDAARWLRCAIASGEIDYCKC